MIRSKLIELLKVITGYDGDDDVEVTMLAFPILIFGNMVGNG